MEINLQDEIFCLDFEIEAMKALFINNEAERWVHGFCDEAMEVQHISRYELALKFVNGKRVLDIAGGTGYGTYLLAKEGNASDIDAVDLDSDAIKYGNIRYNDNLIQRHVGDAETYQGNAKYDVIVSFETIEHLNNHSLFLANLKSQLTNEGLLLISTPIVAATTKKCSNRFHNIEWSFEDFHKLIEDYFSIQEIYVQSVRLKNDANNSFIKRVWRKLTRHEIPARPVIEKYTGQYAKDKIYGGLQVVICKMK